MTTDSLQALLDELEPVVLDECYKAAAQNLGDEFGDMLQEGRLQLLRNADAIAAPDVHNRGAFARTLVRRAVTNHVRREFRHRVRRAPWAMAESCDPGATIGGRPDVAKRRQLGGKSPLSTSPATTQLPRRVRLKSTVCIPNP